MGLVDMREMADHAVREKYAVGAYNIYDWDSLSAVLEAAEEEASPVILQLSMGARRHTPHFALFFQAVLEVANGSKVPVAVQHDHCNTITAVQEALSIGFPAVMYDGSHLPYDENLLNTKLAAAMAHQAGAWLEAELGSIPGFEDMIYADTAQATDPGQAFEFVNSTRCDALAVSVGTSHGGVHAKKPLTLRHDLLLRIHRGLPGFPLVLHGAASVPQRLIQAVNELGGKVDTVYNCTEDDIAKAGAEGVFKTNMDVDNHLAWNAAVRRSLLKTKEHYDPRPVLRAGRDAFCREVRHKMKHVSGTSGKSWIHPHGNKGETV